MATDTLCYCLTCFEILARVLREMDTEDIMSNCIKNVLDEKLHEYKLDCGQENIFILIRHSVLLFLRNILNKMVQQKKKYTIECPMLTCKEKDCEDSDMKIKKKIIYDESPYTLDDLLQCFQELSNHFPKRHIFHKAMQEILAKKRQRKDTIVPQLL